MPERKLDSRAQLHQLRRIQVRINLGLAQILNHCGLPQVTEEEIDKVLAKEGITRPVKPPATSTGHLSTGESVVHRQPRSTPPSRNEVSR